MTTKTYEFTAYSEDDLAADGNISCGDKFTMPDSASVCFSVKDDDSFLSGDRYTNEHADDHSHQTAQITDAATGDPLGNGGQIYAESYHWLYDDAGNWYILIEIEQEGDNGSYLTFYTGDGYTLPAEGTNLTVHSTCNVKSNWIDFKCLDGGEKDPVDPVDPDCIIIEAEDMHKWNFKTVHGDQASGGELVKLNHAQGKGDIWTDFEGPDGCYNLSLFIQDENDGKSEITVKIGGVVVDLIKLDRDSDGGGSNNGGFSEFVIENVQINKGDEIRLWVDGDDHGGEFVRIDKIVLKPGDKTPDFRICDDPDAVNIGFDGAAAGTVVADQFDGVTISAQRDGDSDASENDAMIFDTANPTGGDTDLASTTQGNVLIISEDNDSTDPDDNAGGGTIVFDFDNPSFIFDLKFLDVEEPGGTVTLIDADGNTISTLAIPTTADGGISQLLIDTDDVARMEVELEGSGAIDDLCFIPGEVQPGSISGRVFCDVDCDGTENGTITVEGCDYTIEAEDMHKWQYETVHGSQASGGELARLKYAGGDGDLWTDFTGKTGTYTLKICAQDENDGQSEIIVKIGGVEVGRIHLDRDTDGSGSNNGGFSEFVLNDIPIEQGDEIRLWVGGEHGEYVRIDKIELIGEDTTETGTEPGKEGVEVRLLSEDGIPIRDENGVAITTTTDADGNYTFDTVPEGDYVVQVVAPDGQIFTDQNVGSDDTIDSDFNVFGNSDLISLAPGQHVTDVDAGVKDIPSGSISGRVFCDLDCDGLDNDGTTTQSKGANLVVNGDFEDNPLNNTGWGLFDSLPGWYAVQDKIEVQESDYQTGNTEGNAVIELDANVNAIVCQQVEIIDAGTYCFSIDYAMRGSSPETNGFGIYIDGVLQAEIFPNTPGFFTHEFNIDLPAGTSRIDLKGLGTSDCIGTVIDNVSLQLLIDETVDTGKEGIEVALVDVNGVPVLDANGVAITTTTDADGNYTFDDVPEGNYRVEFTAPDGQIFTDQNVGSDDAIDSDVDADGVSDVVTVVKDVETTDVDAGLKEKPEPGSIAGRIFDDANLDGLQGALTDEPGVTDVAVALVDETGAAVLDDIGKPITATTNADGIYHLEGVPAGDYRILVSAPTDGSFTLQNVGDDDTIDSDVGVAGLSDVFSVAAGVKTENVDAGVILEDGNSLSGDILTDRAATQGSVFIIDHSLEIYSNAPVLSTGDFNGDGFQSSIDAVLNQIVDQILTMSADHQVHFILSGTTQTPSSFLPGTAGSVGALTTTAGVIQAAAAEPNPLGIGGALSTLLGTAFDQPFTSETGLDVGLALEDAKTFLTDTFGPQGSDLNDVVVITATSSIEDFALVGSTPVAIPFTDPTAVVADLTDPGGINASIDVVLIDDSGFVIPDVLESVDGNGITLVANDAVPFGLGDFVSTPQTVSLGTVVSVEVEGTVFAVADEQAADGFQFTLTDLPEDPTLGTFVNVDTDGDTTTIEETIDVTGLLVEVAPDSFEFDLSLA